MRISLAQRTSGRATIRLFSPVLCFYFVLFTQSVYLLFAGFDSGMLSQRSGDSVAYQGLIFITYSVVLYNLVAARAIAFRTISNSFLIVILICSAILSYVAAGAASIAVLRFILFLLTISAAVDISSRYNIDEVCETFFVTSVLIIVFYFLTYPLLSGKIEYDGEVARVNLIGLSSYAAFFPHKNAASEVFSLSLIVSLARFSSSRDVAKKRGSLLMVCGSILAITMTGAVGPLLAVIIGLATGFLLRSIMWRDKLTAVLIACVLMLVIIVILSIGVGAVLGIFGRSSGFTGRDVLYQVWPYFFWEKPMFGYGFGGFFTGLDDAPARQLIKFLPTDGYTTFENAYLDLLIQFGLIGGLLYASILGKAVIKSLQLYKVSMSTYRGVPINVMCFVLVSSLSSGSLLQINFVTCIFVFWIYFGVSTNSGQRDEACLRTDTHRLRRTTRSEHDEPTDARINPVRGV
jgi:exopolysaccharide production protein ExoQ